MGINPTPTNHRSFTFDGKSTREFGVYTTGKDVFNSPERAVEMISIPGRDGEYALDQGHFNNIQVTYRAGIVSDSTTDFAEAISNFRNWLASRKGYCRLTDEYNTEEYRMAVFKNAIALEHEGLLTGEFDVTFDCKPQRWLTSGETAVAVTSGGTITNPTLFDAEPLLAVEGYGEVKFNNRSIVDIENATIGEIVLYEGKTDYYWTPMYFNMSTSMLNVGDTVDVNMQQFGMQISARPVGNTVPSATITDSNNEFQSSYEIHNNRNETIYTAVMNIATSAPTVQLTIGTDKTVSDTVTGEIIKDGSNKVTFTYTNTISYDATNNKLQIRVSKPVCTITGTYIEEAFNSMTYAGGYDLNKNILGQIIGDSTVSILGTPTYIDCDIGEAYMIKGDEIIALNQYIDLGSDLPTLPSGDTEVTYDNTITKVEVKPNWWKV